MQKDSLLDSIFGGKIFGQSSPPRIPSRFPPQQHSVGSQGFYQTQYSLNISKIIIAEETYQYEKFAPNPNIAFIKHNYEKPQNYASAIMRDLKYYQQIYDERNQWLYSKDNQGRIVKEKAMIVIV